MAAERDEKGRFRKGSTGNPGGRPRMPDALKRKLASVAPHAVDRLITLSKTAEDEKVKMRANVVIIERVYGRDSIGSVEGAPADAQERLAALEARAHELALSGDARMLELLLRASAPEKYGPLREGAGEGEDEPAGVLFERGPDAPAEGDDGG